MGNEWANILAQDRSMRDSAEQVGSHTLAYLQRKEGEKFIKERDEAHAKIRLAEIKASAEAHLDSLAKADRMKRMDEIRSYLNRVGSPAKDGESDGDLEVRAQQQQNKSEISTAKTAIKFAKTLDDENDDHWKQIINRGSDDDKKERDRTGAIAILQNAAVMNALPNAKERRQQLMVYAYPELASDPAYKNVTPMSPMQIHSELASKRGFFGGGAVASGATADAFLAPYLAAVSQASGQAGSKTDLILQEHLSKILENKKEIQLRLAPFNKAMDNQFLALPGPGGKTGHQVIQDEYDSVFSHRSLVPPPSLSQRIGNLPLGSGPPTGARSGGPSVLGTPRLGPPPGVSGPFHAGSGPPEPTNWQGPLSQGNPFPAIGVGLGGLGLGVMQMTGQSPGRQTPNPMQSSPVTAVGQGPAPQPYSPAGYGAPMQQQQPGQMGPYSPMEVQQRMQSIAALTGSSDQAVNTQIAQFMQQQTGRSIDEIKELAHAAISGDEQAAEEIRSNAQRWHQMQSGNRSVGLPAPSSQPEALPMTPLSYP